MFRGTAALGLFAAGITLPPFRASTPTA